MDSNLLDTVKQWKTTNQVDMKTENADDGDLIELKWQRPAGDWGYIDVFPEQADIVIVQHGTFVRPDEREQSGIIRLRCSELERNLSDLKIVVDNSKPASWTYTPRIEIGKVSSLKFL